MTQYICFELYCNQPIRIADLAASKQGESETLTCIPGASLRGAVLHGLSNLMNQPEKKRKLLSAQVRFLNAYPMIREKEKEYALMPSPKGFYEDKKQTGPLENVVTKGEFKEGEKRASLGQYCYIDEDHKTIRYMSVKKEAALGINVKGNQVFRQNMIAKGQSFAGAIAVEDSAEELIPLIRERLEKGSFSIGSGRSSGYGQCEVNCVRVITENPYCKGRKLLPSKEVYLYALSPFSMRNEWGEICGLDLNKLAELLGVSELKKEEMRCATSVRKTSGINRTWGCRTQETLMYDAGSVFRLISKDEIQPEAMEKIQQRGIGIKREEGFGMVLFLPDYADWKAKEAISPEALNKVIDEPKDLLVQKDIDIDLRIAAKAILTDRLEDCISEVLADPGQKSDLSGISGSQLGILEELCRNGQSAPDCAIKNLEKYIGHEDEKLKQQKRQSSVNSGKQKMIKYLKDIMNQDIFSLLKKYGIVQGADQTAACGFQWNELFSENEELVFRLRFVERQIRLKNRKEKNK